MTPQNILPYTSREEFRQWLSAHHADASECWIVAKKGKHCPADAIWYIDAVEEALCFGWIDSTHKSIGGQDMQRFTPRRARSAWSELNKARYRRLERLGLMTAAGRAVFSVADTQDFSIDEEIRSRFEAFPEAWSNFCRMPLLYQRVRIDTIQRDKHKSRPTFEKRLERLIRMSEKGLMFGEWNDLGRLNE